MCRPANECRAQPARQLEARHLVGQGAWRTFGVAVYLAHLVFRRCIGLAWPPWPLGVTGRPVTDAQAQVRMGLIRTARRLDPLVLRWGR